MLLLSSNRIRSTSARQAFTLIEVVVTLALLVLTLFLVGVPIFSSFRFFRSGSARADAQTAARLALDSMARELTEAMYVQLDMYDNSSLAFFLPLRVNPDDPNSEIVTPPRPDWSQAIRYWRALYDPTVNYNPGTRPAVRDNTFFAARSALPEPFTYSDDWNRWNEAWAAGMAGEDGVVEWAPISRLVNSDLGLQFNRQGAVSGVGLRNATLQPGFPYLYVQRQLATRQITGLEAARLYRDYRVALTPSSLDYDVSDLRFNPTVVAGEWLRPVESSGSKDYSVYRSRYPLWRLGAPYTGWAQLSDDPYVHQALEGLTWARDPFLLIYRFVPGANTYELRAVGAFDPRSRTMKIIDPQTATEIYDTGAYPYRAGEAAFAFGIDWIDGALRCDFPPPGDQSWMANEAPAEFSGLMLEPQVVTSQTVYQIALMSAWASRAEGSDLSVFLDPDSVRVRVDTDGDGVMDRTLTQVYSVPRENSNECQIGLSLPENPASTDDLQYGWLRVPQRLAGDKDPTACNFALDFRWRNNGVVPAVNDQGLPSTLADEKPDLISAYYRTAAVIDISITVTRADLGASAGQRISQSAHLTRRVKLRNLLREIRYEQ